MEVKGRLLAAVAVGITISAGIILLSDPSALSNLTPPSTVPFRIENIVFAATGFNTSSCGLLNGLVIVKVQGLGGTHLIDTVTIGDVQLGVENTYVRNDETTTIVLSYQWLQGKQYHVMVTSRENESASIDTTVAPVIGYGELKVNSSSIVGSFLRLNIHNTRPCASILSEILVSNSTSGPSINVLNSALKITPQGSASLLLTLPFPVQNGATYVVTLITQNIAFTCRIVALTRHGGSSPNKPN